MNVELYQSLSPPTSIEMIMWFLFFHSVNVLYYIDQFFYYVRLTLHKSHLTMVYNLLDVLFDSVCYC